MSRWLYAVDYVKCKWCGTLRPESAITPNGICCDTDWCLRAGKEAPKP